MRLEGLLILLTIREGSIWSLQEGPTEGWVL